MYHCSIIMDCGKYEVYDYVILSLKREENYIMFSVAISVTILQNRITGQVDI